VRHSTPREREPLLVLADANDAGDSSPPHGRVRVAVLLRLVDIVPSDFKLSALPKPLTLWVSIFVRTEVKYLSCWSRESVVKKAVVSKWCVLCTDHTLVTEREPITFETNTSQSPLTARICFCRDLTLYFLYFILRQTVAPCQRSRSFCERFRSMQIEDLSVGAFCRVSSLFSFFFSDQSY